MPSASDISSSATDAKPSLVADLAIAGLVLAIFAAVLLPRLDSETATLANPLHDIAAAAGSLQSAASLKRAESLTRGKPISRDLDAPDSGALISVSRPIAAEDCARLWNRLLPQGPVANTEPNTEFRVSPTPEPGLCRYQYRGAGAKLYTISYSPKSGKVAYE